MSNAVALGARTRGLRVAWVAAALGTALSAVAVLVWLAAGASVEPPARDGRAWALAAHADAEAGRWVAAAASYEKAVAASRKIAADPGVLCDWADALAMAQGGVLAGRPTELIERALALKPAHPKALEMAGSAAYERRDYAAAASHWRRLLPQLAEGAESRRALQAAISRADMLAAAEPPPAR